MTGSRLPNHARNHLPGGSDPLPVSADVPWAVTGIAGLPVPYASGGESLGPLQTDYLATNREAIFQKFTYEGGDDTFLAAMIPGYYEVVSHIIVRSTVLDQPPTDWVFRLTITFDAIDGGDGDQLIFVQGVDGMQAAATGLEVYNFGSVRDGQGWILRARGMVNTLVPIVVEPRVHYGDLYLAPGQVSSDLDDVTINGFSMVAHRLSDPIPLTDDATFAFGGRYGFDFG